MSEGGDVYVNEGNLMRQALDARLVDDITLTLIPVVLGDGMPLFNWAEQMNRLSLCSQRAIGGGMVELVYESAKVSS